MFSTSQRIWGYETPDGSFAQFCRAQSRQLMPRPKHLTWEEAACYTLTLATAYRMLFGHKPHVLRPGDNVLVWGASGGLGVFATQLCAVSGANAIGVVSDESKIDYVMSMGAKGVLNRKDFNCWGQLPTVNGPDFKAYMGESRKFGKALWQHTGGRDVDIVFEHPGEQTFPVSVFVVKRGGMVVICAGTSGFNLTMDARFLWMRQKRVQGSHFANLAQASAANQLVIERRIDPALSEVFRWDDIPDAHEKMLDNRTSRNMGVLVCAQRPACAPSRRSWSSARTVRELNSPRPLDKSGRARSAGQSTGVELRRGRKRITSAWYFSSRRGQQRQGVGQGGQHGAEPVLVRLGEGPEDVRHDRVLVPGMAHADAGAAEVGADRACDGADAVVSRGAAAQLHAEAAGAMSISS
jgi:NADPH:quinone reductase-like Zn-dependent oxidoreductase